MRVVRNLIPVLFFLLGCAIGRAQVAESNTNFCFSPVQSVTSNLTCADQAEGSSSYEELRGLLWGEVVQQVWKYSKRRHKRNQLQSEEESDSSKKEDRWKQLLRDASYDLSISSHRFVMSMKMHF